MDTSAKQNVALAEDLARKMNTVAHKWEHADTVRNDAVSMAIDLGLDVNAKYLLEIAALMHDVGLDYCEDRTTHSSKSVDVFTETFRDRPLTEKDGEAVKFLIMYHDKYSKAAELHPDEKLLIMLRILIDADTLELLGQRGYDRAIETAQSRGWPDYDYNNPKGETFGFSSDDFDKRFKLKREGKVDFATEPSLVGQLNFQISCTDLLFTDWAKSKAFCGVKFLKEKIKNIIL